MDSQDIQPNENEDYLLRQWRFDASVVNIFEDHIRKSVPFYDEIHRMIAEISDWFLAKQSLIYDLGTSTGECIRRL